MNSAASNLDFVSTYHKKLGDIAGQIANDLTLSSEIPSKKIGTLLKLVQYKDLKNWSPFSNANTPLKALGGKISHMIQTGKADSVKPMLEKIVTGRIKALRRIDARGNKEFLGRGSFRWNHMAITLDQKDIKFLKGYFEL